MDHYVKYCILTSSILHVSFFKIHYSATYATLLPFSVLNYDPPQVDELYDACIKRFTPHLSKLLCVIADNFSFLFLGLHSLYVLVGSFDPHLLVLLAYSLAVADYFPEELIRAIFSIDFLGKLDSQLESKLPVSLNLSICATASIVKSDGTNISVYIASSSPAQCAQHADTTAAHGAQPCRVSRVSGVPGALVS